MFEKKFFCWKNETNEQIRETKEVYLDVKIIKKNIQLAKRIWFIVDGCVCVCLSRGDATHQHHLHGMMQLRYRLHSPIPVSVANPSVYCQQMNFQASSVWKCQSNSLFRYFLKQKITIKCKQSLLNLLLRRAGRSTSRIGCCRSIRLIVNVMHNSWSDFFNRRLDFGRYCWFIGSFST